MAEKSDNSPSIQEQVNAVVSQFDDAGKLPDGVEVDPAILYAAKAEKRYRDTQSAYTKGQQKLKAMEAENTQLAQSWEADAVSKLSSTEQARLEELKVQDPDKWREEISNLENEKRTKFKEKREEISSKAKEKTALEMREMELEEFNSANPEHQITDDVIANDIPPRITNKLKKGEISFKDFLNECKDYLKTPKKVGGAPKPSDDPNLNDVPGRRSPTKEDFDKQDEDDYKDVTF